MTVAPGMTVTTTPASDIVVSGFTSSLTLPGRAELTAAELNTRGDSGLSVRRLSAALERAVANAIGEVGVAAEAGVVASGAAQVRGETLHGGDTASLLIELESRMLQDGEE